VRPPDEEARAFGFMKTGVYSEVPLEPAGLGADW